MRLPEYDDLDATALAALVRSGHLSARELLEAAIERIEARNPALNAIVSRFDERARARADALPDGPFRGVPFLLKDLKIALAGTPTTNSCRLTARWVPDRSSVLAERYEAAGLQILGKTNTPEFGIMGTTEPALRGPCRNPWSLGRSSGGSSGGSAAAVAARIVPLAHAGDGGGSIRIPASACGVFGLKPTRGRVTMAPFAGEAWGGFVQEHVITRSVRDSAAMLDIEARPTPGEPYAQPHCERSFAEEAATPPGRLRVAFTTESLYVGESHPDCVAAVKDAARLLGELGHDVEEARPSFPREEMIRAYFLTVAAGCAWFVEDAARKAGVRPRMADFEPSTWILAIIGRRTAAPELLGAQFAMQRAARDIAAFFLEYDVLLTPTMARPPVRLGELLPSPFERLQISAMQALPSKALLDFAIDRMGAGKMAATPNTELFNQTGQPAMSVPLFWNAEGLPIGVQFAARFGDEATLFRLATQLEEARPWAGKKPS
jgi:amidase